MKLYLQFLYVFFLWPAILFAEDEKNSFVTPGMWEQVSGKWRFSKDVIRQDRVSKDKDESFLLRWKNKLPNEPFWLTFEIKNRQYREGEKRLRGFIVVRANHNENSGHALGIDNYAGRNNGRDALWYLYSPEEKRRYQRNYRGRSLRTRDSDKWQKLGLAVDGPCYEFYDLSDESNNLLRLLFRGYSWDNLNERGLILLSKGSEAQYRNFGIMPLSAAKQPVKFKVVTPGIGESVTNSKPCFAWDFVNDDADCYEDFDFYINIYDRDTGKTVASGITQQVSWQCKKPLSKGEYNWTVEAKTFYGTIWGGKFEGHFNVPADLPACFDTPEVKGPVPKHFSESKPTLTWTWQEDLPFDKVELYCDNVRQEVDVHWQGNKLVFKPSQDLPKGINRFRLILLSDYKEIGNVNCVAVRTEIPKKYSLREDGVILEEGEVFVPIATYRDPYDRLTNLDGVLEAGFNVTHSYYFEGSSFADVNESQFESIVEDARNYLKFCHKNGIRVFLGIRRSWIWNQRIDLIEKYVASLMGEPGLLCWYVHDEPDSVGVQGYKIRNAYMAIKRIDPFHLVNMCNLNPAAIPRQIRSCDINACEAYCFPGLHLTNIITMVQEQKIARRHSANFANTVIGKPATAGAVWCILQVHDLGYAKRRTNHRPTGKEIIGQTYMAMISKATGIIYYWLPSNKTVKKYNLVVNTPDVWSGLVQAVQDLNKVYPLMLQEGQEIDVPTDKTDIFARVRKLKNGKIIVLLVNSQHAKKGSLLDWQWQVPEGYNSCKEITDKGNWRFTKGIIKVGLKPLEGIAFELNMSL